MKKLSFRLVAIFLVIAFAIVLGSCSLFAGDTYLAVDWYGLILVKGAWDMPYPYSSGTWSYDTYYGVETGSYYGEYALDIDNNGSLDYGWYYFNLSIDAEPFTDVYYYLYLNYDGPWLLSDQKTPAPRVYGSDGSWVSSIEADGKTIILSSKAMVESPDPENINFKSK